MTGSYQEELGLPKLPAYEAERFQARMGTRPPDWMRRPQHLTQWGATSRLTARLGSQAELSLADELLPHGAAAVVAGGAARHAHDHLSRPRHGDVLHGTEAASRGTLGEDPLLTSYFERATARATQFTNGASLSWRPRSWLTLTADAGLNIDPAGRRDFPPPRGAQSLMEPNTPAP